MKACTIHKLSINWSCVWMFLAGSTCFIHYDEMHCVTSLCRITKNIAVVAIHVCLYECIGIPLWSCPKTKLTTWCSRKKVAQSLPFN